MSSASRYDAAIATFVGVLALAISAYTAYVQRQQVRAQVYPILMFLSGEDREHDFHVLLENKGVGPAIIRDLQLSLDGQPMRDWDEVIAHVLGPGDFASSYNSIGRAVLAPGETLEALRFLQMNPPPGSPPPSAEQPKLQRDRLAAARERWRVTICYCSTLGDCWTLRRSADEYETKETARCPARTANSFN